MPRKPDPELIDDDAPEADDEWFLKARPAALVLPKVFGKEISEEMLGPKPERPVSTMPKEIVRIKLDMDILEAFKGAGIGWQTRINDALRDWLKEHRV